MSKKTETLFCPFNSETYEYPPVPEGAGAEFGPRKRKLKPSEYWGVSFTFGESMADVRIAFFGNEHCTPWIWDPKPISYKK